MTAPELRSRICLARLDATTRYQLISITAWYGSSQLLRRGSSSRGPDHTGASALCMARNPPPYSCSAARIGNPARTSRQIVAYNSTLEFDTIVAP